MQPNASSLEAGDGLEVPAAWQPVDIEQLATYASPTVDWLWYGYLARGSVTLLTSQWKTGKTTLLSVLLSRMNGGGRVADREVAPCRAGIVTEEGPMHWRRRGERLVFGSSASFFCRPFSGKPTLEEWQRFVDHLHTLRTAGKLDLLVVDTLASFLPRGAENLADGMLGFLRPLERLTAAGAGVLLLHHPRKGTALPGQASRGSGALAGYCDVIVELQAISGTDPDDRRRRLYAWSRHDETPRELVLELSADGSDYSASTEEIDLERETGLDIVREMLGRIGRQMTREMLLHGWPEDRRKPADITLMKWLDRAVTSGFLVRHGDGVRGKAYRYSLPGSDAPWSEIDEILGGGSWRDAAAMLSNFDADWAADARFFNELASQKKRSPKRAKQNPAS